MSISALTPAEETAAQNRPRVPLLDPLLLLAGLGLCAASALTLRGAAGKSVAEHQMIYAGIGLVLCLLVSRIDYTRLREFKYGAYALMIVLNLVVYGMPAQQSAHRWIPLPLVNFQSSEFGKLLMAIALSGFMVDRARHMHERRTTARIMLLALVGAILVIPQPDLGTGLVYVAIGFSVLFFAGTSFRQLSGLVALFAVSITIALVVAPAVGVHVLKCYQLQRITAFLHPNSKQSCPGAPSPSYQIQQSLTALGSGQKTGQGIHATQTKEGFLPVNTSDFVFASLGEIYGFVGCAIVLGLYALLMWRALRIITISKNLFGSLIAAGVLAMFMFQVFVNVGVAIGIAPITGVPLPLVSYGGSSVITSFLGIGLLQSIYVQGRAAMAAKGRTLLS
ncbi:MAG TPA: FtsW/RodA/SpoVE family cell cycle protein [Solirubrobacteraceae bacterium]|nr:FtsW/RodA/SpoVE family cell cycle protein [Solirubrobacteraceae bacterium]